MVDDQLNVNGQFLIHPTAFFQLTNEERTTELTSSKDFKNGKITEEKFNERVGIICKEYNIVFENQREAAEKKVKEVFCVNDLVDVHVRGLNFCGCETF